MIIIKHIKQQITYYIFMIKSNNCGNHWIKFNLTHYPDQLFLTSCELLRGCDYDDCHI